MNKKIIFISFLFLSQAIVPQPPLSEIIATQNYSNKLSQPVCSEYKLSGSLQEVNLLGMLVTLGATTIGTFSCAFYVDYEGTYPDDCNELRCRVKNQQVIINNAKHVINISNDYIANENSSTSLKRKVQQGLIKINEAINEWQKISPSTTLNKDNVEFIEQNLNTPLENLIIKQFEIIPTQFKRNYFIKEAEKERRRIIAEMEKKRIEVEKEKKRIEAEKERIEAENIKKKAELKRQLLIILPVLIFLIIIRNIRKRKKIAAEKEKNRIEAEKQKIKAKKNKEKVIEELNQQISNYEKKYSDNLKNYQNEFKEITKKIDTEEKELIDLKSRHPKIEMIVKSRKIGDTNQKIIIEIKNLLDRLHK